MSSQIKLLSPDLINKIAAGEVVERPASVVKELIENSIDSDAKEINVKVEQGGTQLIEISDNGEGMSEDNAKMALIQHATSKIESFKDLENIHTLGFRGEALASIASVSDVVIYTYDGKTQPLEVTKQNGKIIISPFSARNQGTTVIVRQLFGKIPARRKFLRSVNTEYQQVLEIFTSLALTNVNIGFNLVKDSKQVLNLPPVSELKDRIQQLFPQLQDQLLLLTYDAPLHKVSGFIGHPSVARKDKKLQYIFVNNRPIQDHILKKAVKDAYQNTIMQNIEPVFFIYLAVNPQNVDVNVHPRKSEVKFSDPGAIFSIVRTSVQKTLERKFKEDLSTKFSSGNISSPSSFLGPKNFPSVPKDGFKQSKSTKIKTSLDFTQQLLSDFKPITNNLPSKEVLINQNFFQIFSTYLICEQNDKLLIIDQHAADERINFERIQKKHTSGEKLLSSSLLLPEELKLSQAELLFIQNNINVYNQLGFNIEKLSVNSWQLNEVPEILSQRDYLATFQIITSELVEEQSVTSKKILNQILATLACHSSIRAGQKLLQPQISKLIVDLFNCQSPYSCPHGRPIIWELTKNEIEHKFKRIL